MANVSDLAAVATTRCGWRSGAMAPAEIPARLEAGLTLSISPVSATTIVPVALRASSAEVVPTEAAMLLVVRACVCLTLLSRPAVNGGHAADLKWCGWCPETEQGL